MQTMMNDPDVGARWVQEDDTYYLVDHNDLRHATVKPDQNGATAQLIFWDKPVWHPSLEEAKRFVEELPRQAFYWPG